MDRLFKDFQAGVGQAAVARLPPKFEAAIILAQGRGDRPFPVRAPVRNLNDRPRDAPVTLCPFLLLRRHGCAHAQVGPSGAAWCIRRCRLPQILQQRFPECRHVARALFARVHLFRQQSCSRGVTMRCPGGHATRHAASELSQARRRRYLVSQNHSTFTFDDKLGGGFIN